MLDSEQLTCTLAHNLGAGQRDDAEKETHEKRIEESIRIDDPKNKWVVCFGRLRGSGKGDVSHNNLFQVVAEKIPYPFLKLISQHLKRSGISRTGIYVCHDSMGAPRYISRGTSVFGRIKARFKAHADELVYFSFYIVEQKNHEREIETLFIRSAGFSLEFNERKKRVDISAGNIGDYEAGTTFFLRQKKKGRKNK